MARCAITLEMLIEEQQGHADPETSALIRAHDAAACPQCQPNLNWIARFTRAMREAERLQAPDSALEQAAFLFREKFTQQKRKISLARLVFDSFNAPRTAFARSAEPTAWQRLYQADSCSIELWLEGNAQEGWYLIGQVLSEKGDAPPAVSEALLIASDGAVRRAALQNGEFHADRLPADTYQICLQSPKFSVLLTDVRIGA